MLPHLTVCALLVPIPQQPRPELPDVLFVDAGRGSDQAAGAKDKPLRSLSAAIARLSDPLERSLTIRLTAGTYATTGGRGMPEQSLQLMCRMRPGVRVTIEVEPKGEVVLGFTGEPLVDVREGTWRLTGIQIGTGLKTQRRGIQVTGTAEAILENVAFKLRSHSDGAIVARRGGRVALRGAIRINEPAAEGDESYSGIVATDHGVVEFDERKGASLVLGNGSLQASYYGSIRLGCETARITCRTRSNCLAINNGGRIDLRNTHTTLTATDPKNTPIGLEHDGHILAEDARITITGANDSAIALQKASTLTCNDLELTGTFGHALWASSGSMFVGSFLGDVGRLEATTGAAVCIERVAGKVVGPIEARSGGVVTLPDRVVGSR